MDTVPVGDEHDLFDAFSVGACWGGVPRVPFALLTTPWALMFVAVGDKKTTPKPEVLTAVQRAIYDTDVLTRHTKLMQLDRQCEKFMGAPTIPYSERVHVTISPKGKIFLNQKAHSMMGRPPAIYLYFNRPKDMIILEPTTAITANNAFHLKADAQTGRQIHASPFCKHFGIRLATTEKFITPEVDAIGRMYLKLSETTQSPAARERRSQRPARK